MLKVIRFPSIFLLSACLFNLSSCTTGKETQRVDKASKANSLTINEDQSIIDVTPYKTAPIIQKTPKLDLTKNLDFQLKENPIQKREWQGSRDFKSKYLEEASKKRERYVMESKQGPSRSGKIIPINAEHKAALKAAGIKTQ